MSYDLISVSPQQNIYPISFVQENNGAIMGREPVAEIYTLIGKGISANTDYWLNLSTVDFNFIPLTAFWANAANNANQGTVNLTIYDSNKTTALALISFSSTVLKDGYQFKPMVVHQGNQVKVRSDYAIDSLYFWVKPVVAPFPIQVI